MRALLTGLGLCIFTLMTPSLRAVQIQNHQGEIIVAETDEPTPSCAIASSDMEDGIDPCQTYVSEPTDPGYYPPCPWCWQYHRFPYFKLSPAERAALAKQDRIRAKCQDHLYTKIAKRAQKDFPGKKLYIYKPGGLDSWPETGKTPVFDVIMDANPSNWHMLGKYGFMINNNCSIVGKIRKY